LRLFSFGGYGLALAALALIVVFGAIECPPELQPFKLSEEKNNKKTVFAVFCFVLKIYLNQYPYLGY